MDCVEEAVKIRHAIPLTSLPVLSSTTTAKLPPSYEKGLLKVIVVQTFAVMSTLPLNTISLAETVIQSVAFENDSLSVLTR